MSTSPNLWLAQGSSPFPNRFDNFSLTNSIFSLYLHTHSRPAGAPLAPRYLYKFMQHSTAEAEWPQEQWRSELPDGTIRLLSALVHGQSVQGAHVALLLIL